MFDDLREKGGGCLLLGALIVFGGFLVEETVRELAHRAVVRFLDGPAATAQPGNSVAPAFYPVVTTPSAPPPVTTSAASWAHLARGFTPARILATNARVNLRSGPGTEHPVIATLPRGTYVVAPPSGTRWVQVAAAENLVGWMSERTLGAPGECTPGRTLLAANTTVTSARFPREGVQASGYLLVQDTGDAARISLADRGSGCEPRPFASVEVEGEVLDLFVTYPPESNIAIVLVGSSEEGRVPVGGAVSWSAYVPTGNVLTTVWHEVLPTHHDLADHQRVGVGGPHDRDGVLFPVRVRVPGQPMRWLAWTGSTLADEASGHPEISGAPVQPAVLTADGTSPLDIPVEAASEPVARETVTHDDDAIGRGIRRAAQDLSHTANGEAH